MVILLRVSGTATDSMGKENEEKLFLKKGGKIEKEEEKEPTLRPFTPVLWRWQCNICVLTRWLRAKTTCPQRLLRQSHLAAS